MAHNTALYKTNLSEIYPSKAEKSEVAHLLYAIHIDKNGIPLSLT